MLMGDQRWIEMPLAQQHAVRLKCGAEFKYGKRSCACRSGFRSCGAVR